MLNPNSFALARAIIDERLRASRYAWQHTALSPQSEQATLRWWKRWRSRIFLGNGWAEQPKQVAPNGRQYPCSQALGN
jgi:hypothetical protein